MHLCKMREAASVWKTSRNKETDILEKKEREKKKEKKKTMNEHGIGNVSIVFVSETEKSW